MEQNSESGNKPKVDSTIEFNPNNSKQYVAGYVEFMDYNQSSTKKTASFKIVPAGKEVDEKGLPIPSIKKEFVTVFASGKNYDKLVADGVRNGQFIEVTGKPNFNSFDKEGVPSTSNSISMSTFKKLERLTDASNSKTNEVTIIGNLAKDASIFYYGDKKEKTAVSLEVVLNTSYKNGDGVWIDKKPMFIPVTVFEKDLVQGASLMKKGNPVFISGQINNTSREVDYTGKKVMQYITKVIAKDVAVVAKELSRRLSKAADKLSEVANDAGKDEKKNNRPSKKTGMGV
jgi:single-stranded DNA-binding protein